MLCKDEERVYFYFFKGIWMDNLATIYDIQFGYIFGIFSTFNHSQNTVKF